MNIRKKKKAYPGDMDESVLPLYVRLEEHREVLHAGREVEHALLEEDVLLSRGPLDRVRLRRALNYQIRFFLWVWGVLFLLYGGDDARGPRDGP